MCILKKQWCILEENNLKLTVKVLKWHIVRKAKARFKISSAFKIYYFYRKIYHLRSIKIADVQI